jgi:hypothetical protein
MKLAQVNDIYTDYLITQTGQSTATGCSELLDNTVKHDAFTRMLSGGEYDSKFIWSTNKSAIRQVEDNEGVLILDNSICHKPHSKINEIICYHYDHAEGRTVKGINLLTAMVNYGDVSFPVGYEIVKKDQVGVKQNKKGQEKMHFYSRYTLNELARGLVQQASHNHVKFRYILGDSWFASKENMLYFHQQKCKFILGIPSNRLVAINRIDAKAGAYTRLDELGLHDGQARKIYLKNISFPVVVTRKVFKDGDAIQGEIYLVTNELSLSGDCAYDIYQRRWNIETYHRSLKQNTSLTKSPTSTQKTQTNHIGVSLLAYSRLEQLKTVQKNNHYAIKRKLLIAANQASYKAYIKMKSEYECAKQS